MAFDLGFFLTISGWIFGVIALFIAVKEHFDKRNAERTLETTKKAGFEDNLRKAILNLVPSIPEFQVDVAARIAAKAHMIEYLRATSVDDPQETLDVWENVGITLGRQIAENARQSDASLPKGLAECISYMFISHYSKDRGRDFLISRSKRDDELGENIARYYSALGRQSENIRLMMERFRAGSRDQAVAILSTLRGEELQRVAELFESEKWNKRMVSRMREYLRTRQMSYTSVASKVIEANPIPRLFILFKNEGAEPESEEETTHMRVVQSKLYQLRQEGKAELISPLAPIYFIKEEAVVRQLMESLPEGDKNNFLIFSGAVDPLSVRIETSDRLVGHPARLWENLLKFRNYKEVYESMILKLGMRPSEIIETSDLGFLVEPKTDKMAELLSLHSREIISQLRIDSKRGLSSLTDLRQLDEDDVGSFALLLAKFCNLTPSDSRELAERIMEEARELYKAIYGSE
jgi:hypothetical protein